MKKHMLSALFLGVCFVFTTAASAQSWWGGSGISGEGKVVTKNLDLDKFTGFELSISANVKLSKGSRQEVKVVGQQNIIDNIETDVRNGYWNISFDKNVRRYNELTIYITVPTVDKVALSGSGDIESDDVFSGLSDLQLSISGSGDIEMGAESQNMNCSISGSGDMEVRGSTNTLSVSISGSGDVSAYDLKAGDVSVSIAGSGDCNVHSTQALTVSIVGSGDVRYKGSPNVKSKVVGSGDVVAVN